MRRPSFRRIVIALAIVFVAIQLVPYGRAHLNPPRTGEPAWESPVARALVRRACFDCHSNETVWPAYANVAPVSWLVQWDVDEGRAVLNFSEWPRPQEEAAEAAEAVAEGEMPPSTYLLMHGDARLTAGERQQLVQGLARTIGTASSHGDEE